jgi:hypothetical protein
VTAPLFVAVLTVYDPDLPGTRTLYYASREFRTGPADTPANTIFENVLLQPAVLRRDAFGAGTTGGASRVGYGDLILANGDGALDALVGYGFDGRAITIWRTETQDPTYPTDFTKFLVGTMEQPEVGRDTVTIKLRDRQLEVQVPLQATKYAGDNSLPDGLEGVADDLKGKPKPLCFGKVLNVPAVLVNTSKLIYQVNDGAIASVSGVYDRGVRLGNNFDTWTLVDEPTGIIRALAYVPDGAVLYGVGDGGTIVSSEDGTTWGDVTNDWSTTDITAIAAGRNTAAGEAIVMVGGVSGTLYLYETPSLDSGQGTAVTSQFSTSTIRALHYWSAQHLWIAVGDDGKISTSADGGQSWTARTSGVATALYGIATSQSLIVVVGASGVVRTSADGITWTSRTSGVGASTMYAAVYGGGQFVVVGADSKVAVSANGILWGLATGGMPTQRGIVYADGLYVVAGDDQDISISGDGITWTPRAEGATTTDYFAIAQVGAGAVCAAGQETGGGAGEVYRCAIPGTYSSAADLEDEDLAPAPGTYKVYLAGGYFRLGASPTGLITADVTQGAAAGDRTAGQLFTDVLTLAGKSSGDWSAADVTALDTANASVLGFWTADEMRCDELLTLLAASVGAWWGVDRLGIYRIKQLTAPSGTPAAAFVADDMLRPLTRVVPNDPGRGLPVFQTIVRWGKVYAVQDDLAGGVSATRRALVSKEWREAKDTDTAVQTIHLLAPQTVEDSLLTTEANAQSEADRRQTLRGVLRHLFATTVALDAETMLLDLGDVATLTHSRYGLSAGKDFRILGIEPDARAGSLGLSVWG